MLALGAEASPNTCTDTKCKAVQGQLPPTVLHLALTSSGCRSTAPSRCPSCARSLRWWRKRCRRRRTPGRGLRRGQGGRGRAVSTPAKEQTIKSCRESVWISNIIPGRLRILCRFENHARLLQCNAQAQVGCPKAWAQAGRQQAGGRRTESSSVTHSSRCG